MKGDEWRIGEEYKVVAKHSTKEAVDFTRIDARKPVLQSDKSVYKWGSDMILTIIDPDGDKDSQLAEFVGDTGNSKLIIQSSKGTIQNYRLKETGNSTGIFQGILGFIGVNDDETTEHYDLEGRNVIQTQGFEYDDGFLEVSKDEKIKISYSNDVETAELVVRVVKDYSHLS
ncbi:MAG: hypothetical protein OEM28_09495 [Nitrosopumilus sp.]|nr:hypothetical protein [Nitrosopumilus sp.]